MGIPSCVVSRLQASDKISSPVPSQEDHLLSRQSDSYSCTPPHISELYALPRTPSFPSTLAITVRFFWSLHYVLWTCYVAILTCLSICLSCLSPCQLFYYSVDQNVCLYYLPVAVNIARDACVDRSHFPGHYMVYSPASPIFER